jgi:hypothetical protein
VCPHGHQLCGRTLQLPLAEIYACSDLFASSQIQGHHKTEDLAQSQRAKDRRLLVFQYVLGMLHRGKRN